jgi:hypothetical protein
MEALAPLRNHPRARVFPSVRFEFMIALLEHARFVLGNSSMGIREAPFFGTPTIDVGSRQQGRSQNPHIVHVDGRYGTKETWLDRDGHALHPHTNYYVGGNTKFYGAALFRLRREDFGELRHHGGVSPAWPCEDRARRLMEHWQAAAADLGLQAKPVPRGGLSDANYLCHLGPTLDGLGPAGGNAHCSERSADGSKVPEYLETASLVPKAMMNVLALRRLLAG